MKNPFLLTLLIVTGYSFANGQQKLPVGTTVSVRAVANASSEKSSTPSFVAAYDVKDASGTVVIAANTPVLTKTTLTPRRSIGQAGKIEVEYQSTTATDGTRVLLTGSSSIAPPDEKGKVIGIAVGVGFFIFPMLAYLAKKGPAAELETDEVFNDAHVTQ